MHVIRLPFKDYLQLHFHLSTWFPPKRAEYMSFGMFEHVCVYACVHVCPYVMQ